MCIIHIESFLGQRMCLSYVHVLGRALPMILRDLFRGWGEAEIRISYPWGWFSPCLEFSKVYSREYSTKSPVLGEPVIDSPELLVIHATCITKSVLLRSMKLIFSLPRIFCTTYIENSIQVPVLKEQQLLVWALKFINWSVICKKMYSPTSGNILLRMLTSKFLFY